MSVGDIRKSEIKIINKEKWKFDFRENGYVIVSRYSGGQVTDKKKQNPHWEKYLHAHNLESCLQYVYTSYAGQCPVLRYDELESA